MPVKTLLNAKFATLIPDKNTFVNFLLSTASKTSNHFISVGFTQVQSPGGGHQSSEREKTVQRNKEAHHDCACVQVGMPLIVVEEICTSFMAKYIESSNNECYTAT